MLKQFIKETVSNNVNYTAFVLDDESHEKLAKFAPEGWKVFSHHMTIISPPEQKGVSKISPEHLGQTFTVTAIGIAKNEKVMTAKIRMGNIVVPLLGPEFPHVTIAVSVENGGKPVMSNNFSVSDFENIMPIKLTGTIEEILK